MILVQIAVIKLTIITMYVITAAKDSNESDLIIDNKQIKITNTPIIIKEIDRAENSILTSRCKCRC